MLGLVGGGVCAEEVRGGEVVGVAGGAAWVGGVDEEVVEALGGGDYGVFGVEYLERVFIVVIVVVIIVVVIIAVEGSKVLLDFGSNDSNGMVGAEVQIPSDEGGNVGCNVVGGMRGQVAAGIGVFTKCCCCCSFQRVRLHCCCCC